MADLFEHDFLQRQRTVYPELDVHAVAAAVREFNARKPVRNPNGLLVHWLNRAEKARRRETAKREVQTLAELDLYAEFWVQLLARVAQRQVSPADVLRCFAAARGAGLTPLNKQIDVRLAQLGESWPTTTATPPATGTAGANDRRSRAGLRS